jgi:sigma-B regulation protein RsbU (phosphoserine phosphatase)
MLTMPMFNPQQKIIGVVQVLNKRGGPFTSRDERLLGAISSQAAISIENARLYQQEIQQQIINRELQTAHAIQASFLPARLPQLEGWDLFAFWRPISSVAGDFYDFYRLDDGRLAIVIADVSGKGIPAALFMALTVTVLRFAMSLNLPPGEVARRANELIIADQRSRMFATTFIGYISLDTGHVDFASAGHNPALVYRAVSRSCDYVSAAGVAIGIFGEAEFAEEVIDLQVGDILVLYTDGITEVMNNDEDEFGEDRLEAIISENAGLSAHDLAELVLEAITVFAEDQNLFDDATLVVIKRTDGA